MSSPKCPGATRRCRRSWSAAISTAGTSAPARSTMAPGVAIAAAAAKRIMDAGRPLRTIRIVWFGAEEVGLFGGLDYRAKHGKEPHYALDRKRFRRRPRLAGRQQAGRSAREAEAEALGRALAPLGIVTGSFDEADGSDIGPMLADGLPGVAPEPGRHPLFRPSPHARRHARQDRSGAASAECRGLDGDAGGAFGRN